MRRKEELKIDLNNIPNHIAFIMDGNGRWAKRRGLPRTAGHRAGVDALVKVLRACREYGVKAVSVYAFSTENYKRSDEECKYIFELIEKFVQEKLANLKEHGTKLVLCGDLDYSSKLSETTKAVLKNAEQETKDCSENILNLCFSYGGRHEVVSAINKLIQEGKTAITEEDISGAIYTRESGDPDLIVRASGEHRLSNFLLWQSAYSELYFPQEHWPEFDKKVVEKCIIEYQKRERRFGNVK